jgi:hypothetical protein
MTAAKALDEYLRLSPDKFAKLHWDNYRGDSLEAKTTIEWLLLRAKQDISPFYNLDKSIVEEKIH